MPAQPVDATPSGINLFSRGGVYDMSAAGKLSEQQRNDMCKNHVPIQFILAQHGGIAPAARRQALLTLTLAERENISRGIACGSSIREIAKGLQRSVSTVSRKVARHGGRPQYRASDADQRAWESAGPNDAFLPST
jgi:DNA-binding NarL/FixJ family response regulator